MIYGPNRFKAVIVLDILLFEHTLTPYDVYIPHSAIPLLIQISDFCLFAAQPPYEQTVYIQDNNVYMQDNYVYMHT